MTTRSRPKAATLNKSANFGNSLTRSSSRSKTLNSTDARSILENSSLENIEIEYIKNLQQQVHFLELECSYLKQQLTQNGLQTSLKYDKESSHLKSHMDSLSLEKSVLERSLRDESAQKERVLEAFEESERQFNRERELLLKEIDTLKKQKLGLEEIILNKSVELTRTRDDLTRHSIDVSDSLHQIAKSDQQNEQLRRDNLQLRAELNDTRALLIARDTLIKDLQHQLADPSLKRASQSDLKNLSMKLTLTNDALSKESVNTRQLKDENERLSREVDLLKTKLHELNRENSKLSTSLELSLKQNEADLIMAKKNADLSKHNIEKLQLDLDNEKSLNHNLKTQIEQYKLQERLETKNQAVLKKRIEDLERDKTHHELEKENYSRKLLDQHKSKERELSAELAKLSSNYNSVLSLNKNLELRVNQLNESLDKLQISSQQEVQSYKNKLLYAETELDNYKQSHLNEKSNAKTLQAKAENLARQEEIHNNLISSLKLRVAELESQLHEHTNLREPDLMAKLKDSHLKTAILEDENRKLRADIELLNIKIAEIDRLKQFEDLVNSQRWGELSQLAESMKNLSQSMAATSHQLGSTAKVNSASRSSLDEFLKSSLN